jgi:hypothetical protein
MNRRRTPGNCRHQHDFVIRGPCAGQHHPLRRAAAEMGGSPPMPRSPPGRGRRSAGIPSDRRRPDRSPPRVRPQLRPRATGEPRAGQAGPGRDASVSGGHARSVRLPIPPRSLPPMAAPGPTYHYPAALRWSQAVSAMTSSTLLIPTTTSTDVRGLERASLRGAAAEAMSKEACDVCPHPHADHDAIAARFCSATGNGAIARGCVCRS